MVADLRRMQENQGFSENLIDKLEFTEMLFFVMKSLQRRRLIAFLDRKEGFLRQQPIL